VRYLVNVHHHLDHAHGNGAYAELFGAQLDIVSTSFARAALAQAVRWFTGFVQRRPVPLSRLQEVPNQERCYAFVEGYLGGLRDSIPTTEGDILHLVGRERVANVTFDRDLDTRILFEK
jgi:glyoxylase-like metal-dependent hydrolase (beta-lactamase superfamily II)